MAGVISSTTFSNLLFEAAGDATAYAYVYVTMGVGVKVLRTFVLMGANVPGSESSRERKF